MNNYTKEQLQEWIFTLNNSPKRELTVWEQEFVDSVESQLKRKGGLSTRQIEVLEKIYADKTE